MTVELVLLAMVAAFLGLRLYSVLGKRTGHEQEEPLARPRRESEPEAEVARRPATIAQPPNVEANDAIRPAAEPGLRAIMAADRGFEPAGFLHGAEAAYGMVLEAFWNGDRKQLANLCDEHVLADFEGAIAEREERGEQLDNRLIRIERAQVVDAEYQGGEARITVRFDADIAALVRDKDGNMVGGSLSDAVETHDIWTFARNVRSDDPNWLLVETDDA